MQVWFFFFRSRLQTVFFYFGQVGFLLFLRWFVLIEFELLRYRRYFVYSVQGLERLYRANIAGLLGVGWGDVAGMRAEDEGRMGQDTVRMGVGVRCIEGRGGFIFQGLRLI